MRRIIGAIVLLTGFLIFGPAFQAEAATPPVHWAQRVVYVENHAYGWPLQAGVNGLTRGTDLRLVVVKRCPHNAQCIRVYNQSHFYGRQVGYTINWMVGPKIVKSQVNLRYGWQRYMTYRMRVSLVCHELGHAVGLGHVNSYSCMRDGLSRYSSTTTNWSERRWLNRWY